MKFSSTPNTSVQQFLQSPVSKLKPPFLLSFLFHRISQIPGQDHKINKTELINTLPSLSDLTSRIHPPIFLHNTQGFISQEIFTEFSIKPVYSILVGENSQIYGFHITRKCICKSKNCIQTLSLMPPWQNSSQALTIIPQAKENYSSHRQYFFENILPSIEMGRGNYECFCKL